MTGRRSWLMLGLGAAALFVVYLLIGAGDEQGAVDVIREVLHAAELRRGEPAEPRKARIQATFDEQLEPDVRIAIPELAQPAAGRAAVQALALNLADTYESVRFKIEQTEISATQHGVKVTASITFFGADRASELRDTRHVTVELTRGESGFRIGAVNVGPRSREEPEARP